MLRPEMASTGCRLVWERAWAGKPAIESQISGQCAGCGEDSRRARDAKCAQRRFDGGGCDGKGPLFGVYPVYDDVANLTWLADANAAGLMNWATANQWAADLVVGGIDNWCLASSLNTDGSGPCSSRLNCTGSEMGNLF
jgi:hypothetical protein